MRGKAADRRSNVARAGITPAHAGKSPHARGEKRPFWDHPRPCGEKPAGRSPSDACGGSPPPMRGKVVPVLVLVPVLGITPAHAGKRSEHLSRAAAKKDHPRPCGEKLPTIALIRTCKGSPPPMRGKGPLCAIKSARRRITPAHAGKRSAAQSVLRALQDHPRPCGEKQSASTETKRNIGSPPPMRGKGSTIGIIRTIRRITPAHAGKSIDAFAIYSASGDHPRPCGEKLAKYSFGGSIAGSPPPMRGKAKLKSGFRAILRITPAHAGKSRARKLSRLTPEDHPRPCGEKCRTYKMPSRTLGSPPPMRGKDE